jgi:hypothetical protein
MREQPWKIKDGKNGGVVICIGSKQIWFSGSSLESLERVMKAHDAALADEREHHKQEEIAGNELARQLNQLRDQLELDRGARKILSDTLKCAQQQLAAEREQWRKKDEDWRNTYRRVASERDAEREKVQKLHAVAETAIHALKGKLPNPDICERDRTGEALIEDLTRRIDALAKVKEGK